jgi:hypothetical protein
MYTIILYRFNTPIVEMPMHYMDAAIAYIEYAIAKNRDITKGIIKSYTGKVVFSQSKEYKAGWCNSASEA